MKCPVCKIDTLGSSTLVEGLPAKQCSNCGGSLDRLKCLYGLVECKRRTHASKSGEIQHGFHLECG